MDTTETPQWGQRMDSAEAVLRAMAADTGGTLERDNLGRLVLVHPPTPPAPSR